METLIHNCNKAHILEAVDEPAAAVASVDSAEPTAIAQPVETAWGIDAEKELCKIPFFVRGKAKRNTELYARERGVPLITVDTLYDAKAHFSR